MVVWKRIHEERSGFLFELSQSLAILDWSYPNSLIPVNDSKMIIASDYSGQHKEATHEAYSFLITTERGIANWIVGRDEFRKQWLPDGRRISFKQLREAVRRKALNPFLDTANMIRGNTLTILVDNRISRFMPGGASSLSEIFPDCFPKGTPNGTIEKMFRLASLLAMITSGLREQKQSSYWISDHDEALETFDRREQLGRLASYLIFGLVGWENPADMTFLTTDNNDAPSWSEDLVAIPDLIAGTWCQLSNIVPSYVGKETWVKILSSSTERDERARLVGNWMGAPSGGLCHVLMRLEQDDDGNVRASAQQLSNAYKI